MSFKSHVSVDMTGICRFYSLQWMLSSAEREQNLKQRLKIILNVISCLSCFDKAEKWSNYLTILFAYRAQGYFIYCKMKKTKT